MSLVICSNRDTNYEFADVEGREVNMKGRGTSSASTFTNHFSNVFTIPRNSEVAVQSVKINRNNILRITEPKYFSFFMGKQLTATTSYRTSCSTGHLPTPQLKWQISQSPTQGQVKVSRLKRQMMTRTLMWLAKVELEHPNLICPYH